MDEASVFHEALQKQEPADRAAYLDGACAGNATLRRNVEMLLDANSKAGDFLNKTPAHVGPTLDQSPADRPGTAIGPYKLLQQIGEGGMGVVWMAEQTQPVQRKVALKVIKPGMDSRQVIARFEAERQALAMMDHVNIARVLDAGTTTSGLPYFVMELVHGVPITQYCDDIHLTPRQRLELFVPVCQAIQHAHQKGIIHRDIKPSNVMITLYDGKPVPKVIDFGVAKATEQHLTERTLFTQYGTMVGTLEYMSPEQAEMSALGIDTRSDIFSLGVLLYELLTGSTPLTRQRLKEAAYAEVLRLIKDEEPPRPSTRLTESGEALASISAQRQTEPAKLSKLMRGELDWIVMKTLEKDRNRRYETANAFAADVQRYLADEPVLACPPSAMYRVRKFARRNKRALATAALLGVMLVAAIGAVAGSFGWVMRDKAARLAKASDDIQDALRDAGKLQQQQKWAEALAVVKQTQMLLVDGGDENLSQRVRQRAADFDFLVKLEDAGLSAAETKGGHFDMDKGAAAYAKAFREYGIDVEALVPSEAGALLKARGIGMEGAIALDSWAMMQPPNTKAWRALLALARAADPDPLRDRAREAVAGGDRKTLKELASSDQITELPGPTLILVARLVDDPGDATQSVALLRKAQQRHPDDFWLNCHLAIRLYEMKPARTDEAVRFWSAALALRPKSPGVFVNLGLALVEQHSDEAIAAYKQAIRLKPDYAGGHSNLGVVLKERGRTDEAITECREAIRLEPDLTEAHLGLGAALEDKNRLDEAVAEYREAIRLQENFAGAHSNLGSIFRKQGQLERALAEQREAVRLEPDLAEAHASLGSTLQDNNQLDEAIAEHQKAIRLKPGLAAAYSNLGNALASKGQMDEAIAEYRKAIRLKSGFADAHMNLGNALASKGQMDEATAEYREAIRLKPDDAASHCCFGGHLRDMGRIDEAITECRRAIRLKPDMAEAHANLGSALQDNGQLDEAITECREAVRLKPSDAAMQLNLGAALESKGQKDEAIVEYRKAIQLKKDYAEAHSSLGNLLRENGQLDEAIAECREATHIETKLPAGHHSLGLALAANGRLDEAIAELRETIRLKADLPEAHNNLGGFLLDKGRLDEAIVECREAIRQKKDFANAHNNLGNALVAKDRPDEGIAEFREVIRLEKNNANAHTNLGTVLVSKGQLTEAIVECREAVRLKKDSALCHYNLGEALVAKGQLDEAVAEWREAVHLDKDFEGAHHDLAEALAQMGQQDEAIAEFREAIRLKKNDAETHSDLGFVLVSKGQLDAAVTEFREAIRINPDEAAAHHNLGGVLALNGQHDEAIVEYREAIRLKKDDLEAYKNLCLLFTAKGQTEEGIAVGNEAARLAPNDAQALNSLAWLLVACHETKFRDPGRAVELAKHAVSLAPKDGPIWNTVGLAHLRAGNWKESAAAFEKSMEFRNGGDANDWYFLAMAHWRMNHQEEARQWYDKAMAWTEKNKPQDADLLRFRAEAEELLKVKKQP